MPILRGGKLIFSAYDKKIAELHSEVEKQARLAQEAIEAKDTALREVKALGERKAGLVKKLADLEQEIGLANKRLEHEIDMRRSFIDSAKQELKKEEAKLDSIKQEVEKLNSQLNELQPVFKEVNDFVSKGYKARIDWLEARENLQKTKAEQTEVLKKVQEEKEELLKRQKNLDEYYDNVKEFSGRLTENLRNVREITEYLNKSLEERGVPLTYGLPPDKITELPFL